MVTNRPSPTQIRESVALLVKEPELMRSRQLVDFLTYVVEKTLADEETSLNAYSIGTNVLGRDKNFDPQTDSIVRVQARRLRKTLDDLYRRGVPGVSVRVYMPVGHYVPRFSNLSEKRAPDEYSKRFEKTDGLKKPRESEKEDDSGRLFIKYLRKYWIHISLAIIALVIIHAVLLSLRSRSTENPVSGRPVMIIEDFEAANELAANDSRVLKSFLVQRLSSFDRIDVHLPIVSKKEGRENQNVYQIGGQIRSEKGGVGFNVVVTRKRNSEVVWSHGYTRSIVEDTRDELLKQLSDQIAADIAATRGAVLTDARGLLRDDAFSGKGASHYSCRFLYRDALGPGREKETEAARNCYNGILGDNANDAIARAVLGALDGFDVMRSATPGDNRAALMNTQVAAGADAVRENPVSSFAHEIFGHILWAADDVDGAMREFLMAKSINPGNYDAEAMLGILAALGDKQYEIYHVENVLALSLWPAGWYYTVRALECLDNSDYAGSLQYALMILPDDPELGLSVLIAAAPNAGRPDLVDAKKADLLSQTQFMAQGIVPRLSVRLTDRSLLEALRTGLMRAGVTAAQLDGPYKMQDSP